MYMNADEKQFYTGESAVETWQQNQTPDAEQGM